MFCPQHILAIRLSALGDVAMTVPVIKNVLQQNPSLKITFISASFFAPLFVNIDRLHFVGVDVKGEYKGIRGLYRLSKRLQKEGSFDALADLHDVLRTKILRQFFTVKRIAIIDKGREEKRELTRPKNKNLRPLKSMFQRYADVFTKLGCTVRLDAESGMLSLLPDTTLTGINQSDQILVGIAPFAKHNAKMYPLNKMIQVAEMLLKDKRIRLLFFSTTEEAKILEKWAMQNPNIFLTAGKLNFAQELNVISQLKVMVSMDSANMHFASLFNVPVVSIWGGTHPFLGFNGWNQSQENIIQSDLPCRPSSVFGNKDCPVHGVAGCMQEISPTTIYQKVKTLIY